MSGSVAYVPVEYNVYGFSNIYPKYVSWVVCRFSVMVKKENCEVRVGEALCRAAVTRRLVAS